MALTSNCVPVFWNPTFLPWNLIHLNKNLQKPQLCIILLSFIQQSESFNRWISNFCLVAPWTADYFQKLLPFFVCDVPSQVFPLSQHRQNPCSQPDPAWKKSKCCLTFSLFEPGFLIPKLCSISWQRRNYQGCYFVISHNNNMSPTCIRDVESSFHNGAVLNYSLTASWTEAICEYLDAYMWRTDSVMPRSLVKPSLDLWTASWLVWLQDTGPVPPCLLHGMVTIPTFIVKPRMFFWELVQLLQEQSGTLGVTYNCKQIEHFWKNFRVHISILCLYSHNSLDSSHNFHLSKPLSSPICLILPDKTNSLAVLGI